MKIKIKPRTKNLLYLSLPLLIVLNFPFLFLNNPELFTLPTFMIGYILLNSHKREFGLGKKAVSKIRIYLLILGFLIIFTTIFPFGQSNVVYAATYKLGWDSTTSPTGKLWKGVGIACSGDTVCIDIDRAGDGNICRDALLGHGGGVHIGDSGQLLYESGLNQGCP